MTDNLSLLTFPVTSKAFSNYQPGSSVIQNHLNTYSTSASSSGSPPRKTARLDGDSDHSSSVSRTREKGKGKEKAIDGAAKVVKRVKIINPHHEIIPETYFDNLLPKIHDSITAILDRPSSSRDRKVMPMSYESMYQATRAVVLIAGKSQWIYDKLKFELKECVKFSAERLSSSSVSDKDWLFTLVEDAQWFEGAVSVLESLLTYLDRVYLLQKQEMPSIRQLATTLFRAHIFESSMIVSKLKEGITEWARWERVHRAPHEKQRKTVISLLDILHEYSLFTPLFLTSYSALTRAFYTDESNRLSLPDALQDSPGNFLLHCSGRIEEERRRSAEVLGAFEWSWREIETVTERGLMEGRLDWLSKGIITAMDNKDVAGLKRMYQLFSRVDGLKLLCEKFKAHLCTSVQIIVKDVARDEEMVDRLLELKAFIDRALPLAFCEDPPTHSPAQAATSTPDEAPANKPEPTINREFQYASLDAFQTGFRVRRNKPAEMIAKHIDRAMRKGQGNATDEEFAKKLDAALMLYRFTEDKDVFRTFYHRALAKRLLLQRSASDDFEKSVLKKLKEQYDPEFSMGDHMFRDLALSRDIMREFHDKPIGHGSAQNLSVMVLQRSFWPFAAKTKDEILLPPSMQDDLSRYAKFYRDAHQGHKLDFDHSLGTIQMRARFRGGEKELSLSLYQGAVLLLFNDQNEMGFAEIKEMTRMDDGDLRRTLQSLACSNKKVLKKRPVGKDVNDTDMFIFNADFTDPRQKVHINSIQVKETPEETNRTHHAIEGDRKHYVDAAIVRIMKAKKTMSHQQLIPATIDSVKSHFVPEVRVIKERIEQLIEQEYIRRDDDVDNPNMYVYVA